MSKDDDIKRGSLLASTMTDDELRAGLTKQVEQARQKAAHAVGKPVVITLEAMGYRIVPSWVVDMLDKILSKTEKKS